MRIWFVLCFILLSTAMAQATEEKPALGLDGGGFPQLGQPIDILVSHASIEPALFKLKVVYRPNSETKSEEELPAPDDMGRVEWTPSEAGITTLIAEAPAPKANGKPVQIKKNVSVRYGHFPLSGILIFCLAALTLFGGLIVTAKASAKTA